MSGNLKQKKAKKQLEKIDTKDEIEPQHEHYKTGLYFCKIIITITFQKQALGLVLDFSQPSSKGYIFRGVITKFKRCTHTPLYIYILSRGAYYTCRGHLWGPYIQQGLFQNCKGLQ